MQTRWLAAALTVPANNRRTIASQILQGPILIRGGFWGGLASAGLSGFDFGWIGDGQSVVAPNGTGIILENNVALSTPIPYQRFNIHRMQNDVSALVEGLLEFGGNTGPNNWRPLHFVKEGAAGARLVFSCHNNTGGALTFGFGIQVIEQVPQGFLDCLKHLVS